MTMIRTKNRKPAANRNAMDNEKINMQHCETYTKTIIKTNCTNLFGHSLAGGSNMSSSIYKVMSGSFG